ncbi:hypothetical protein [Streptomyces sp. NPDC055189]
MSVHTTRFRTASRRVRAVTAQLDAEFTVAHAAALRGMRRTALRDIGHGPAPCSYTVAGRCSA